MTRKTFELFGTDESRGVSPVIGVILMVAITVILAAVIGTFVLGLGENVSTSAPQAQLTLSADQSNISVAHKGGDAIPAGEIKVVVSNESNGEIASISPSNDATEELTVGDTGTIETDNSTPALYWPGYTANDSDGSAVPLVTGTPYEVQIIHTESDQLILDRTVRP